MAQETQLELLVYSPLMEDDSENTEGWEKATIDYVQKHKSKVCNQIRGIAKTLRKSTLQTFDVEEIYSEIVMYLYKCDDYNLSKAVERSRSDSIVSLDGYVNTCIKFCVSRYCTQMYKSEKDIVSDHITSDEDGKELSILDTIADTKAGENIEEMMYDLESLCKCSESMRYKYGPDIYMIWFIRLLTLNKPGEGLYKDILSILGITKKELSNIERYTADDELMLTFAKSIHICGVDSAIDIIRPYVYSAQKIEDTIQLYC